MSLVHSECGECLVEITKDESTLEKTIHGFLSIPYSKSVKGNNRFCQSELLNFNECLPATMSQPADFSRFNNAPWQPEPLPGSPDIKWNVQKELRTEDCLTLNIWKENRPADAELLPVFVWIYGGGFLEGSSSLPFYHGASLAAKLGVTLVSINYRVGPLGFLSLPSVGINGNQGIEDQVLALTWIQNNIHIFGGNKRKVCIFGESAGSSSVSMHLTNERSWPLFQAAFMFSGSLNCPWALVTPEEAERRSRRYADGFLDSVAADDAKGDAVRLEALRRADAVALVDREKCCFAKGTCMWPWLPHRPGGWLQATKGPFHPTCDLYFSLTSDEGSCFLYTQVPEIVSEPDSYPAETYVKKCLEYFPDYPKKPTNDDIDEIMKFYENSLPDIRKVCCEISKHWLFEMPMLFLIDAVINARREEQHSTGGDGAVKGFLFDYLPSGDDRRPYPSWCGCVHGYEIAYLFGRPFDNRMSHSPTPQHKPPPIPYDGGDQEVARKLMDLLRHVKIRLDKGKADEIDWPSFNSSQRTLLTINNETVNLKKLNLNSSYESLTSFWAKWLKD